MGLLLVVGGAGLVLSFGVPARIGPFLRHHVDIAQAGDPPLFDPAEFLDESTLDVTVLQDWHVDTVNGVTRQKLIEIKVAEWWPGRDYRVPVRLIVPLTGKATGFWITGDHAYGSFDDDVGVSGGVSALLIAGGVGLVHTMVQPLESLPGGAQLLDEMWDHFLQTQDARYTTFWIWPMTLMRAVTAAYAESDYVESGKIAASGGSKNGFAPAVALIQDDRFTAICSSVAPAYASPLRLYDQAMMDAVTAANDWFFDALDAGEIDPGEHSRQWYAQNAWGTSGNDLHTRALDAGWTWEEIRQLAVNTADEFFLSENWDEVTARGADVLLQPGSHDHTAYDILWGAQQHPEIPVYYQANGGHAQTPHPAAETGVQNLNALLVRHFFGGSPMLEPPTSSYQIVGNELHVSVTFDNGPQAESGRIFWIYDRYPGGSAPYLWKKIADDDWAGMTFDAGTMAWEATISLDPSASSIEFFSNHGLTVDGRKTYLSSPYTRVELPSPLPVGGVAEMAATEAASSAVSEPAHAYPPGWVVFAVSGALAALAVGGAALYANRRWAR